MVTTFLIQFDHPRLGLTSIYTCITHACSILLLLDHAFFLGRRKSLLVFVRTADTYWGVRNTREVTFATKDPIKHPVMVCKVAQLCQWIDLFASHTADFLLEKMA